MKLLEYERRNDKRVLKNTTPTSQITFVGLGTENKDEYERLVGDSNKNIVFTDRENVQDMSVVTGTQSIYQVQGTKEQRFCTSSGNYILHIFNQQCSCTNCIANPEDINKYHYIQHRNWKEVIVREKEKQRVTLTGEEEYQRLTVNELKDILREQELPISGQKDELVARLLDRNNNNNDDTVLLTEQEDSNQDTKQDTDNSRKCSISSEEEDE